MLMHDILFRFKLKELLTWKMNEICLEGSGGEFEVPKLVEIVLRLRSRSIMYIIGQH